MFTYHKPTIFSTTLFAIHFLRMAGRYNIASDSSSSTDSDSDIYTARRLQRLKNFTDRRNRGNVSPGWSDEPPAQPGQLEQIQAREEARRTLYQERTTSEDWCQCDRGCVPVFFAKSSFDLCCCQELETIKDRCQEHLLFSDREKYECIVSHPSFWHQCLYPTMLDNIAYLYRKAGHPGVKKRNDINAKRRYIAYRQFTVWIHGRCGYKYRRHIPQCVTKKIRTTFPSDRYVGYEEAPDSDLSGDEIDEDEDL